ncbi:MAG: zinc ribbon domain-containing protein, partial [Actinomycetota bacterium]
MTEPLRVDFAVEFPYRHSTGPAIGRFLEGLRDRVILGRRCEACDRVVVPANDHCETCAHELGAWVEVGPAGAVVGLTAVADGRTF